MKLLVTLRHSLMLLTLMLLGAASPVLAQVSSAVSGNSDVQSSEVAPAVTDAPNPTSGSATPMIFTDPVREPQQVVSQPKSGLGNNGMIQIPGVPGSSVPWSIVILLTALTLIPSILLCVTPFARLLIVFHFLRQALGLQTTPSNQTLIGLSLILTFFLMQPVGKQIYQDAIVPMQAGQITAMEALNRGEIPMRKFMIRIMCAKKMWRCSSNWPRSRVPASPGRSFACAFCLPAYILSELKAGFQIGTVLFLPFLIVDMVVASITTSVGMLQLPPVVISTPLKLLLFLMVDGWHSVDRFIDEEF